MKIHRLFNIFLIFSVTLLSAWNVYGVSGVISLEETPLGYYEQGYSFTIKKKSGELNMTPAKNQDPLGTCVSFTASSCCEYYHPNKRFSEAEFTVLAETQIPTTIAQDCKSGLFLGNALSTASKMGFIEEERLSYEDYLKYVSTKNGINTQLWSWKNTLRQKKLEDVDICVFGNYNRTMIEMGSSLRLYGTTKDITGYRFGNIYPIHHVSKQSLAIALDTDAEEIDVPSGTMGKPLAADIKSATGALSQGFPVAAALNVYENCWDSDVISSNNNTIKMPIEGNENYSLRGSHAIVLTGFNEYTKMFELKNSWGRTWGKDGFSYIPYDYVSWYSTELIAVDKP